MLRESDLHSAHIRSAPSKGLAAALLRIAAIALAAIAVLLPWRLRNKYGALLRWIRDLLMQNSRAVRRWALKRRWSWDNHENR
jgi:hypothetical protein